MSRYESENHLDRVVARLAEDYFSHFCHWLRVTGLSLVKSHQFFYFFHTNNLTSDSTSDSTSDRPVTDLPTKSKNFDNLAVRDVRGVRLFFYVEPYIDF